MEGMSDPRPVFPLRFHDLKLRELVREVAARANVSQNDIIEQAILHDVVIQGELLAADLDASARRLAQLSNDQVDALVDRGLEAFAEGESNPDPLQMHALHPGEPLVAAPVRPGVKSHSAALAAFHAGD